EPAQTGDLLLDDGARLVERLLIARVAAGVLPVELLHRELDRRQRILDLVREAARDLLPGADLLEVLDLALLRRQLADHVVEGAAEIGELAAAAVGDAGPEVALGDAPGGGDQGVDAPRDLP